MPRFTLSAFANFVDVLRLAADEGDRSRPIRCAWSVLGEDAAPLRASCGVQLSPDARLGDPRRFDYLVVIGGLMEEMERPAPALVAYLQRAAAAGVPLAGVCTGGFTLHRAGLMAGYRCCVSWFHRDDYLGEFPGLEPVSDQIFVTDRDRLTCSGGVNAAHFAAHLVGRHVGAAAAQKSLDILLIGAAQEGGRPQPGTPLALQAEDPLVRRALALMREAMADPPPVERLAARLGLARRSLERRFAAALAMSPQQASRALRLAEAKRLLRTGATVTDTAAATGFADVSHLVRAFRAAEGVTPDAWRRSG